MEDCICLDSDFLIDFLRNKDYAVDWLKLNEEKNNLATTTINIFELYYGLHYSNFTEKKESALKEIINNLIILNISIESAEEAGKQAAKLKKEGKELDFRDILIGTIALKENFSLKTNNKEHFERIDKLKVI